MIEYCAASDAATIIVGTEEGILHKLRKESPAKTFVPASPRLVCPNMKLTSLEDVREALETMKSVVRVEEPVRSRAARALEKMLAAGRD
jgi:quinolinate synthase